MNVKMVKINITNLDIKIVKYTINKDNVHFHESYLSSN